MFHPSGWLNGAARIPSLVQKDHRIWNENARATRALQFEGLLHPSAGCAERIPKQAPQSAPKPGSLEAYCGGLGVVDVLGGRIGYVTCGWSPVSDVRKAVILEISSSVRFWPSWLVPMRCAESARLRASRAPWLKVVLCLCRRPGAAALPFQRLMSYAPNQLNRF